MRQRKQYRERHVYYFKCLDCGENNRQSFKRKNQRLAVCRKCRVKKVDPNQQSLFDIQSQAVV